MSAEILSELIRRAEALTDEEKLRLAAHLTDEATRTSRVRLSRSRSAQADPGRQLEQQWLIDHRAQYEGEWVALDGDLLIAHGPDGREVMAEARGAGVAIPFVVRVESGDELPLGGW
ncbi:MAG TPA: DUF5678 domain-containing protein [Blastocatellia bacterium]|nr:DUF5678 domain-containing protein [Blastocatellia bacterium]